MCMMHRHSEWLSESKTSRIVTIENDSKIEKYVRRFYGNSWEEGRKQKASKKETVKQAGYTLCMMSLSCWKSFFEIRGLKARKGVLEFFSFFLCKTLHHLHFQVSKILRYFVVACHSPERLIAEATNARRKRKTQLQKRTPIFWESNFLMSSIWKERGILLLKVGFCNGEWS